MVVKGKSRSFKKLLMDVVEKLKFAGATKIMFIGEGLEVENGEVKIIVCEDNPSEELHSIVKEISKEYEIELVSMDKCRKMTEDVDFDGRKIAFYQRKGG